MQILEKRDDEYIVRTAQGTVAQVARTPYTELKLDIFNGKPIEYDSPEGFLTEVDAYPYSRFMLRYGSEQPFVFSNPRIYQLLLGVLKCHVPSPALEDVIRTERILHWVGISVDTDSYDPSRMQIKRDGHMVLPKDAGVNVMEYLQYHDGSRVAKIYIDLAGRRHHFRENAFYALVGRDEIGQFWMHFVPPSYGKRNIIDCELWLCGGQEGDEIIFSPNKH